MHAKHTLAVSENLNDPLREVTRRYPLLSLLSPRPPAPIGVGLFRKKCLTLELAQFLKSNALPRRWQFPKGYHDCKQTYCAESGIELDSDRPVRDGFESVFLPEGWGKELSSTDGVVRVFDASGHTRLYCFCSFDTEWIIPHCRVVPRFVYSECVDESMVFDVKQDVWYDTILLEMSTDTICLHRQLPESFLNEEYPNWRDASAYWDIP